MRRGKTSLLLMEQLVMLLVFALAAALCLRAFVYSDRLSRQMEARDRAADLVQNAAETVRATGGDVEAALAQLSGVAPGQRDGFGYFVHYGEDWEALSYEGRPLSPAYILRARKLDSGVAGLGAAEVEAYMWTNGAMESLFRLETAWQEEVSGHGA